MAKDGPKFKIENNILKGIEIPCDIENRSLGKFVLETLEDSANFVGQVDAITGEEYTYEKMRERSVRCALWMRSQGLLPGDVVAICSHNQLDVAMPCFAALYLGAAFSPWDEGLDTTSFRHLLNLMRPKIAFVNNKSITAFTEAAHGASLDLKIVVFERVPGFLDLESVIAEPIAEEVKNFRCAHIESSAEIALIMCSSGTTGLSKGIALSHEALLRKVHVSKKLVGTENDWVVFSPISWTSWVGKLIRSLALNTTRIVQSKFDTHSIGVLIEKFKLKVIFLLSDMINIFLKSGALEKYDLSSLTRVLYGGSPLTIWSREAFAKFVPNALISAGYGMTEMGGFFSIQTVNSKPGSCGQIIENAQLKVIDPNTGCKLGPNQKGELLMKAAYQMSFYYNNPAATAKTVDEEGWVHSGDLGYYDEDGEIFVLGRFVDLITYRGYRVSPIDIESVIWSHPGVEEVVVIGIPHPADGEHPVAFVARATNSTEAEKQVTEMELVDLVAAELSDNERLRGGVRFVDHIPTTPSGKVMRRDFRDMMQSTARIGGDRQGDSQSGTNASPGSLSSF